VRLATEAGLGGLSLGQLVDTLGVSKSGLFAHWRSKEDLQLATIDHARLQWVHHVITPALAHPRGIRRLWALHQTRMDF
jgi:AcrR family transcriptional regulator